MRPYSYDMGEDSAAACEDRSAEGGEPPECFETPQSGAEKGVNPACNGFRVQIIGQRK